MIWYWHIVRIHSVLVYYFMFVQFYREGIKDSERCKNLIFFCLFLGHTLWFRGYLWLWIQGTNNGLLGIEPELAIYKEKALVFVSSLQPQSLSLSR